MRLQGATLTEPYVNVWGANSNFDYVCRRFWLKPRPQDREISQAGVVVARTLSKH